MDTKTLMQCVILAHCQTPREPKEIPLFLRVIERIGAVVGRPVPFTEVLILNAEQQILDLRRQKLLHDGRLIVTNAKGRDTFKEFQRVALREYGIDLEEITALAKAVDQTFEIRFGEPLPPKNPAWDGSVRAKNLV